MPIHVSIILPSLNVATHIRETLDSVCAQTLKEIEILCVDAGSTDGTAEIIKEYAEKDSRIRWITSDQKSYGYQMNLGIREARGEYIGIVETDDYVEPDMFQTLYEIAAAQKADIVKADFDMFTDSGSGERLSVPYSLRRLNRVEPGRVYSREDYINRSVKPECYIWNAVYRRAFLTDNEVRFHETPGASFQDFGFRYQTIYFAERILATNRVFYHYRRDNKSASTYHPRTVEFNLRESEFVLRLFKDRGITDMRLYTALANEITEFAFWPYMMLLQSVTPAESTADAYEGFREILRGFIEKGYLSAEVTDPDLWKSANLLLEGVEVYCGYARVMARMERDALEAYLQKISGYKDIVLFGSGIRGNAAYVFFTNKGIVNVKAFCDNDATRQSSRLYGVDIFSPQEAVQHFPDALFIITSPAARSAMTKQLLELGVDAGRISVYTLSVHPAFCTAS